LSHIADSFVIARDTAFTYKGKPVDAKAIGRELGVRYMLEGSVRRVGEAVEVNAQLISTDTGAHVWADRFEGEIGGLGKLQFEVVARLANSLGAALVKAEALRAERERPNNPDAVDLTMRGYAILFNFNGANKSTWNEAIALFERALTLDPKNAPAMTGLATALIARPYGGWSDDPKGDFARAGGMADAALALRPDDSEAHFVKALLFERDSQIRAALAEPETAIADDPNNARAIAMASYYRMFLGHAEEGVAGQETALRLRSARSHGAHLAGASLLFVQPLGAMGEVDRVVREGAGEQRQGKRRGARRAGGRRRLGRPRRRGQEGGRRVAEGRSRFHIVVLGAEQTRFRRSDLRRANGSGHRRLAQGGLVGEVKPPTEADPGRRSSIGRRLESWP
jgi:tetratricopeptide (TPR) repeat protein